MRKVLVLLLCLLSIDHNERHLWLAFDTLGKSLSSLTDQSSSTQSSTDSSKGRSSSNGSVTDTTSQNQLGVFGATATGQGMGVSLNSLGFVVNGSQAFSYSRSTTSSYSKNSTSGDDAMMLTVGGAYTYSAGDQGGALSPGLALASMSFSGTSTGFMGLTEAGSAGTVSYQHEDSWAETTSLSFQGSFGPGWSLATSGQQVHSAEVAADTVGGNTGNATVTYDLVSLGGPGGALFTATRTATYNWNARGYSSSYTNVSQGDATAVVLPDVTPGNGLVQVQPASRVSGTIFDVTVAVLVTQLPRSPALPNGQPALGPLLDGISLGQPPVPLMNALQRSRGPMSRFRGVTD